jgi:hypothetical protein
MRRPLIILSLVVITAAVPAQGAQHATSAATARNCATLNKKYPHGVGRPGAHDKTKSRSGPVTNFTRNKAAYLKNKSLDRDHDGIACEKH